MMQKIKNKTGFTIIEIMIVLGILVMLMVFLIPQMLRSRSIGNEAAAIANCRLIVAVCHGFYGDSLPHTYPSKLADLIPPVSNPPYIDTVLAGGQKQGYNFIYTFIDSEHFTLQVNPVSFGITGNKYFFADETATIHFKEGGVASATDSSI